MDKQAQWDIETLQKTIGVIPYEEMERDAIERAIKALEKQVPQKVKKYKCIRCDDLSRWTPRPEITDI
jgi:hypothetical protein